ncbi:MAG TPA: hypothetical protein VN901_10495 [Candidatus Acidoferrales bacterium]|nr:hypothetical protein [Candidatus Acidoferrales bacterium]
MKPPELFPRTLTDESGSTAEHVEAAHLPVKGLLDLLGVDLARLVNRNAVPASQSRKMT